VAAGHEGQLELGSHTVGRAYQDGCLPALEAEAGAKAADVGKDLVVKGGSREPPNVGDSAVGLVDVDTGVSIRNGLAGWLKLSETPVYRLAAKG
jgi:hypothetical protein